MTIDKRITAEIDLEFPFEVDGQKIEKIDMRRPKLRDSFKAKRVRGDDMERGVALLADLCSVGGVPLAPEHFEELDEVDFNKVQAQYEAFTGRATQTNGN